MVKKRSYKPFDSFIVRTPLFPYRAVRERKEFYDTPVFREALLLASPGLLEWVNGRIPEDKREKTEIAVRKYLYRSATRCTPFGLFAGCTCGTIGDASRIELPDSAGCTRSTRLDMQYLCALIRHLEEDRRISDRILYYPNDSIYEIAGTLRYIEYHYRGTLRSHQVSSVELSPPLTETLQRAADGVSATALAEALVREDVTFEDALEFVREMTAAQLLKSELSPSVVGGDVLDSLLAKLSGFKDFPPLTALRAVRELLGEIDRSPGGVAVPLYGKITSLLEPLGVEYDQKYLFQTDLYKPTETATLSRKIVTDIEEAIRFFMRMENTLPNSDLELFCDAFVRRYEGREVSLAEALDPELGIGFPVSDREVDRNDLIDDIVLPLKSQKSAEVLRVTSMDLILLRAYIQAVRGDEIAVRLETCDFGPARDIEPPAGAETIAVLCSVLADRGEQRSTYIRFAGGTCGASLLGRFCHLDPSIRRFVDQVAECERSAEPEKILAEIAHLPESRIGNIASRPLFRDYVIHYLSNTDNPDQAIPVSDLTVSVRGRRILLRSRKHGREVLPMLTCAHNYSLSPLPIYSFLCALQKQDRNNSMFTQWGELFSHFDYVPRLQYKNIILKPRQWIVRKTELAEDSSPVEFFEHLRSSRGLPSRVIVPEGDNQMYADLDEPYDQALFLSLLNKRQVMTVEEFLFDEQTAIAHSLDGAFVNECLLVFRKIPTAL